MRLKGPVFPSFERPPRPSTSFRQHPDRALPKGSEWSSHTGRRQRFRNLRNTTRSVLNSKDPETVSALVRIREAVKDDPEPEFGFLNILAAANRSADDTGVSIVEAVDYMLMKWAEINAKVEAESQ